MDRRMPGVQYYADTNGVIRPFAGNRPRVASDLRYIYGVVLYGSIYPIFDLSRRWVIVCLRDMDNIQMTRELYDVLGRHYPRRYRSLFYH